MEKFINALLTIPIMLVIVIGFLIALPFMIIFSPYHSYKRKKKEELFLQEYYAYLIKLEGKNFFCYNNRKKGFECIEQDIIPNLPKEVEPIFLNGKQIESDTYNTTFLSRIFYSFRDYNKFPQLFKIRDGKVIDTSLNNEFFNYLNNENNKSSMDNKIEYFFALNRK